MDKQQQGLEAFRQKKYDEALKWFNEAIEENPHDPLGFIHFGDVLLAAGEAEKAQNFYRKALEIKELPAPYYSLGTIHYQQGRYEEAAGCFEKALRLGLADKDTHFMLGMCLMMLNQPRLAIPYLQRSTELDEKDADARFQYALALVKSNCVEEALKQFRHVLAANPEHADALYNTGAIYLQFYGQPDEALRYFEQAVNIQPDHLLAGYGIKVVEKLRENGVQ
jgi:tetratricopeptide (TPR) repeat protein